MGPADGGAAPQVGLAWCRETQLTVQPTLSNVMAASHKWLLK